MAFNNQDDAIIDTNEHKFKLPSQQSLSAHIHKQTQDQMQNMSPVLCESKCYHDDNVNPSTTNKSECTQYEENGTECIKSMITDEVNNDDDESKTYEHDAAFLLQHKDDYAASEISSCMTSISYNDSSIDIDAMMKQFVSLKQHPKYKTMIKHNQRLKSEELLALIYYTNSESCYHKMANAHHKSTDNKWKHLYLHATNAINKMYHVFHYKNNTQQHCKMLYHAINMKDLGPILSSNQINLNTLTRFTADFHVAKSYGTDGLLIMDDVFDALYSGTLKGADVSWISMHDEWQYVILPTTLQNVRELSKKEMKKGNWISNNDLSVYIANEYRDKNIALSTDNSISTVPEEYQSNVQTKSSAFIDEMVDYKDICIWFLNEVNLKEEDNRKYFDVFMDHGFDTMDAISLIEKEHLHKMGIRNYEHVKEVMAAIKRLCSFKNASPATKTQHNENNTNDCFDSILVKEIIEFEDEYETSDDQFAEYDSILIQEIMRYENRVRQCPRSNNRDNPRQRNHRSNNAGNGNNSSDKDHKNDKNEKDGDQNSNNNDKNDEKKDNDDNDKNKKTKSFDMSEIIEKLKELKQHSKYKIMIEHNKQLLDDELISLIYYCDSEHFCKKMKQVHRNKCKDEHFKRLYFHATNGVEKIYQVFHFKNENQKYINQLYHGSMLQALDAVSQDQVFFKTIMSFSSDFGAAKSFAVHSMLIIDNLYNALVSGQLRAADVRWISKFKNEFEYIVLPTTYYNLRLMDTPEIKKNKWFIGSHINLYISDQYKTNQDPFCQIPDTILEETVVKYDKYKVKRGTKEAEENTDDSFDSKTNDLSVNGGNKEPEEFCKLKFKHWLCGKVRLKQYLPLFEKFEYNDIRMIEFFDKETMREIGIKKELHCKLILKKALQFKKSQNELDLLMNSNKQLDIYRDAFEVNGIITMNDLRQNVVSYEKLGEILGVQKERELSKLWNVIHPSDLDNID